MRKNLILVGTTALFLTSCAVSKSKTSTSKTIDIYGAGVIHKPVIADLEVKETKVSGTATLTERPSLELVKQHAVADAIKKANCDILVEPTYVTETVGDRVTATVTGFPGSYKNFRNIKTEDLPLMEYKAGTLNVAKVNEPAAAIAKKKKKVGLIIGGILVGAAVITAVTIVPSL